jgi:hypothetical protein
MACAARSNVGQFHLAVSRIHRDSRLVRQACHSPCRQVPAWPLIVQVDEDEHQHSASLQGIAGMSLAALMRNRPRIADDARFAPTATADLSLIDVDPGKLYVRGMTRRQIHTPNVNQPRASHPLTSWDVMSLGGFHGRTSETNRGGRRSGARRVTRLQRAACAITSLVIKVILPLHSAVRARR